MKIGRFPAPSQARARGRAIRFNLFCSPAAPPTSPRAPRCKKGFPLLSLTQQSA
ncbi:MAG: hypothetical protein LBQ31_11760 [Bacteroidales bacterium]|nr:hypothetical protein [Bacteroidales bacterium]